MRPVEKIVYEGKTYDQYAVSLSSAPRPIQGGTATVVNLAFIPYYIDENGVMQMIAQEARDENGERYVKTFRTADIANDPDLDAKIAFAGIKALVEQFAVKKSYASIE